MPTLSEHDPEPSGRTGPPSWFIAVIVLVILAIVVLHLTGVVGPA